jgi:hypothetical protein
MKLQPGSLRETGRATRGERHTPCVAPGTGCRCYSAKVKPATKRGVERQRMFITKKHISRRSVLRGMGVTLALPLLDSMVPAQTPLRRTAAFPRSRLACLEMLHGSAGSSEAGKHYWSPAQDGSNFDAPACGSGCGEFGSCSRHGSMITNSRIQEFRKSRKRGRASSFTIESGPRTGPNLQGLFGMAKSPSTDIGRIPSNGWLP